MYRRGSNDALRHLDFTLFDMISMQLAFLIMYWITGHRGFLYFDSTYRVQATIFFSAQMALGLFSDMYDHVFTRDALSEFRSLFTNIAEIWLLGGLFILITSLPADFKELLIVSLFYFDIAFFVRQWNKERHKKRGLPKRRIVVVTTGAMVRTAMERLKQNLASYTPEITGVLLLDQSDPSSFSDLELPVFNAYDKEILDKIAKWWIDDAFLLLDEENQYPKELMENFLVMGVTIHVGLSVLDTFSYSQMGVDELGSYKVITNSIRFVSDKSALMKRLLDILGGLVGTFLTGIIFIFIAPLIYIKSPGPIFFSQQRIGQNGRVFRIYKFRSMYMDAEKRKAELMAQNKIQGGLMFKMDDDPRIIGSEKKGKDGKPKGIGNFIRNTSLDEFPQFLNVLKGEMSLVGTRPPTLNEWNEYDPAHRIRMSAKPGITGMWQVSGRSQITDFEQVVALDRQYIENWSFWLDIKILFKTVKVVLKHEGAS